MSASVMLLHNLESKDITCIAIIWFLCLIFQSRKNVGSRSTRGLPSGGFGQPAAEQEHGYPKSHFHPSEVCKEHSENHPIHEDGVSC